MVNILYGFIQETNTGPPEGQADQTKVANAGESVTNTIDDQIYEQVSEITEADP